MFLRACAIAIPILASVTAGFAVHHLLPAPGSLLEAVTFWALQLVVATTTLLVLERGMRALLPLAFLLSLSLVFPDQVPKRFRLALRANTSRALSRRIGEDAAAGKDPSVYGAAETVLGRLAALSRHDRWTRGHSERVRAFNDLLMEEMGLSQADSGRLRWAALLHDIGKLNVPASILRKPADLDEEEWEAVRRHPIDGARLIEPLKSWLGPWATAVDHHHERIDGSGYPNGLTGDEISLGGRLLAVADAFEVMTTSRPYKRPLRPEAARQELVRCAGSQFDPVVVRCFLNISIGRIRRAMGPMALLAEIPFVGVAPRVEALVGLAGRQAVTTVGAAAGMAAGVTALAAAGAVAPLSTPAVQHPTSSLSAQVRSAVTDGNRSSAPQPVGNGTTTDTTPPLGPTILPSLPPSVDEILTEGAGIGSQAPSVAPAPSAFDLVPPPSPVTALPVPRIPLPNVPAIGSGTTGADGVQLPLGTAP